MVRERSHDLCEVNIKGHCMGVGHSMHHRNKQGRIWTPSNVLHTCGHGTTGCHGWIEAHPKDAQRLGLWVPRVLEWWSTPVFMAYRGRLDWWLLNDEGTATRADSEPDRPGVPRGESSGPDRAG